MSKLILLHFQVLSSYQEEHSKAFRLVSCVNDAGVHPTYLHTLNVDPSPIPEFVPFLTFSSIVLIVHLMNSVAVGSVAAPENNPIDACGAPNEANDAGE